MTILYIDDEHCTSMEQLCGYFEETPSYDSPLFYDILDYARSGDISSWLREKGESVLADKVDCIDRELGDSDYFSEVCYIILGQKTQTPMKPDFSQCFTVENVSHEINDINFKVFVALKVLQTVNENYDLKVETEWGTHVKKANPFKSKKDEVIAYNFNFRKRPDCELNAFTVFADEIECFTQNIVPLQMGISENTIENIDKQIIERVSQFLQEQMKNSAKPSEKRYPWKTESFLRIVENDKRQREEKQKEMERQRQERLKEEERKWMIERFRRKHGSK